METALKVDKSKMDMEFFQKASEIHPGIKRMLETGHFHLNFENKSVIYG